MSYKRPHRYDVVERQFPVRLTIAVKPEQNRLVNRALLRTVGEHGYGVTPAKMWTGSNKAHHLHLYSVYDAMMFLSACPQARLYGEPYEGNWR